MNILIVDDNQDTALAVSMLLKAVGHSTHVAHDGRRAIELAEELRPQVILLDIGLPGMNGYEVASQLRRTGFDSAVIVAVSGYGQQEDRERSREAGFDDHLVKPVELAQLKQLLEEAAAKTT